MNRQPKIKRPTGGGFTASPFFVPSAEAAEYPHFPQARPLGSPPRPACGLVRPFPSLCPSKPATARRGASLARPATAAAPPRLDGPPRPAEARRGVTARPGAPKPATGRGSPSAVRRPASPPCPSAVRLALARRPPWRGDHRPPQGCAPPVYRPVKNLSKILIASFLHLEIRVKTHFYNWDSYWGSSTQTQKNLLLIVKKSFWRG